MWSPACVRAILAASVAAVSTTAREAVDVLLGYVDEYGSEEGNTVMITTRTRPGSWRSTAGTSTAP